TRVARAIQEMWQTTLGIEVTLKEVSWTEQITDVQTGNFEIARISWFADFNDAVNFLETFTIPTGNNMTNWTNDEYNKLIAASYKEVNPELRMKLLQQAENILLEEMPTIPIFFYTYAYVQSDRIQNIHIDPLGTLDFK